MSGVKRVDDFKEGEPVEICIPGADSPDSVFPHKDGRVSVVQEIAGQVRNSFDDLPGDLDVSLRRDKHIEAGRGEKGSDELPCFRDVPWLSHYPRMSCNSQKLIKDRPGGVPGIWASALGFKPAPAGGVIRRIPVRRVNQDVGVNDEHYRPSMAWYRAPRSETSTSAPPLRNAGSGGSPAGFFRARNSIRRAVSTSSDIVRPWRAASRFSCAITVSSMFKVVFIWNTIQHVWLYVKARMRSLLCRPMGAIARLVAAGTFVCST
jgi:hypothetical protein